LISRRSRYGTVDFSEGHNENQEPESYCRKCLVYHIRVPLKNRIYPNGEPIPADSDQFLQCYNCGEIYPIHEVEKEPAISDSVEVVESPFDIAKNSFLGIDSRTSVGGKNTRKKRERQKQLEDINDPDLKKELAKGNTLISYIEYQPH
jgi:hypothetical protein